MKSLAIETLAIDATEEIARFAGFDHPTRRFIAHALTYAAPWPGAIGDLGDDTNQPLPFKVSQVESADRAIAYRSIGDLRAANVRGAKGRSLRRQGFGGLLGMTKIDLKWKRLKRMDQFIFCYERLVGHMWRDLLGPCWKEAASQRRKKVSAQLPLDPRLISDDAIPTALENEPSPRFYPTLRDADAIGVPLLSLL